MKDIQLNEGQQQAVEGFKAFLEDRNAHVAILTGAAGTGKTTVAKQIVDLAIEYFGGNATVMGCAPTHKAAQVLKESLRLQEGQVGTIASKIYHKSDTVTGYWELGSSDVAIHFMLVDEASMIGKKTTLDIIEWAMTNDNKVLFVGDPYQLEPVKDQEMVFKKGVCDDKYRWQLSQVMRQAKDSGILALATAVRDQKKVFLPTTDVSDVHVITEDDAVQMIAQDIRCGIESAAIDFKNKARYDRNIAIRAELELPPYEIVPGEHLVAVSTAKAYCGILKYVWLRNCEHIKATRNTKNMGTYTVTYFMPKGSINDPGCEEKRTAKVTQYVPFEVPVTFFSDILYSDVEKKNVLRLFACFHKMPEASKQDGFVNCDKVPAKLRDLFCVKSDKGYYNLSDQVAYVQFGYSITAHKAQGSQWQKVYITSNNSNSFRWGYTAVTRATEQVFLAENFSQDKKDWIEINSIAAEYNQGNKVDRDENPVNLAQELAKNKKRRAREKFVFSLQSENGKVLNALAWRTILDQDKERAQAFLNLYATVTGEKELVDTIVDEATKMYGRLLRFGVNFDDKISSLDFFNAEDIIKSMSIVKNLKEKINMKKNEVKTVWVNTHGKEIAAYIMSALKIRFGSTVEIRTTTKDDPDFVPGTSVALDLLKLETLGESILASLKQNTTLAAKQEAEEQAKKEALIKEKQEKEKKLEAVMNGKKVSEPTPAETVKKEEVAEEPAPKAMEAAKLVLDDKTKEQLMRLAARKAAKSQKDKLARLAAKKKTAEKVVESAPTDKAKALFANSSIDLDDMDIFGYC